MGTDPTFCMVYEMLQEAGWYIRHVPSRTSPINHCHCLTVSQFAMFPVGMGEGPRGIMEGWTVQCHPLCPWSLFWTTGLTLIARFMGPTWGPPAADRTQVGPILPREPCSLGRLSDNRYFWFCNLATSNSIHVYLHDISWYTYLISSVPYFTSQIVSHFTNYHYTPFSIDAVLTLSAA